MAEGNPLFKKGLSKVVKEFILHNQKVGKYYQERVQPEEKEEREEKGEKGRRTPVGSPRVRLRSGDLGSGKEKGEKGESEWMAKFDQPKRLEDIDVSVPKGKEISVEAPAANKKSKKAAKKAPVIESSDYESEEDSFELEPPPKPSKKSKREAK